jgi:hypothetical protein
MYSLHPGICVIIDQFNLTEPENGYFLIKILMNGHPLKPLFTPESISLQD